MLSKQIVLLKCQIRNKEAKVGFNVSIAAQKTGDPLRERHTYGMQSKRINHYATWHSQSILILLIFFLLLCNIA